MDFKLYQMDVKSIFLNGTIKEEVYVEQPLDFEDYEFLDYVFKLNKALCDLKQAPRVWFERLNKFLIDNEFTWENADTILFLKKQNESSLVVQIYVDDIIFYATKHSLCEEFAKLMQGEFKMSLNEKLNFLFGL